MRLPSRPTAAPTARRLAFGLLVVGVLGAFPPAYRAFGPGAAILFLLPVLAAGHRFGARAGLVAGLVAFPAGMLELVLTGSPGTLSMLRTAGAAAVVALAVTGFAIGRQRDAAVRARAEGARFRDLFEDARDVVFTHDLDCRITSINTAGERLLGWTRGELAGLDPAQVIPADQWQRVRALMEAAFAGGLESPSYEVEWMTRSGGRVTLEISALALIENGRPAGIQGIARDVTARRRAEADLRHQALHDNLTGLANRALLSDRLDQSLRLADRVGGGLAVAVIDLRDFKGVNDGFGHAAGDLVLKEVAQRLQAVMRSSDTVARMGGDEFCVVMAPLEERAAAASAAERFLNAIEAPLALGGRSISLSACAGLATFPADGRDAATLLRRADVALQSAQRGGLSRSFYAPEDDQQDPKRLAFRAELKAALRDQSLVVHYQPKVSLGSGAVVGMEALVRWPHPELGLLAPDRFVPLAEESGLIDQLTEFVMRTALRAQATWSQTGFDVPVAVNLSARHLHDRRLLDLLHELGAGGDLAGRLELELTETAVMTDAHRGLELLHEIDRLGIRISIDDFGTGYSSFNRLHRLPISELKIERNFVADMAGREQGLAMVRSMIDLGHNLGLGVIAEGVEDDDTARLLRSLGCDTMQGFGISRPLPLDELREWLEAHPAAGVKVAAG